MDRFIELSKLSFDMDVGDVIDYLLDNGYGGIINDFNTEYLVEYDISDLVWVWDNLKLLLK